MQNLILQGLQIGNCKSPVLDVIRTLGTSNQAIYYNLLNIDFSSLIDLDTSITMSPKVDAPYLHMDTTVRLGPLKFRPTGYFRLSWTVYTFRSLYCIYQLLQKTFYCNDHTIMEFGIIDSKNSSTAYVILYELTWHMIFGLEQEGGSLIVPMALAHPLHPIDNRSRNRRRNLWVGWYVSSWWPLFPSQKLCVKVNIYIYAFSMWVRL